MNDTKENQHAPSNRNQTDVNMAPNVDEELLDAALQQKIKGRNDLLRRIEKVRSKREKIKEQNQSLSELKTRWMHRFNQAVSERTLAISNYARQETKLDELQADYEILLDVNVLQDTFYLWYKGAYATINGLRIGMCVSPPVESATPQVQETNSFWNNNNVGNAAAESEVPWHEINAAIGMVGLLMHTLQNKLNLYQSRYMIQPRGSTTLILSRKTKQEWELFHQPTAFQFFARRNWNAALNMLGFCLYEIVKEVERLGLVDENKIWTIPLEVTLEGDWANERIGVVKVGGLEFAFNGNGVEWTKAMRYMAIDLKMVVAFVAKHVKD